MDSFSAHDTAMMREAMGLARSAAQRGEVPVGAVLTLDGEVVGRGANSCIEQNDSSAHAEIIALRDAGRRLRNYRFPASRLYVTLEPCMMCLGALVHARVEQVIFATADPKTGVLAGATCLTQGDWLNHRVQHRAGLLAQEASEMLVEFFRSRRGSGVS